MSPAQEDKLFLNKHKCISKYSKQYFLLSTQLTITEGVDCLLILLGGFRRNIIILENTLIVSHVTVTNFIFVIWIPLIVIWWGFGKVWRISSLIVTNRGTISKKDSKIGKKSHFLENLLKVWAKFQCFELEIFQTFFLIILTDSKMKILGYMKSCDISLKIMLLATLLL